MNCRTLKKRAALSAGGDLPEKDAARLRAHLERCEACRREFRDIEAALANVKSFVEEEAAGGWTETDWTEMIRKAVAQGAPVKKTRRVPGGMPSFPAWRYAAALTAVLAALAAIVILKNWPGKQAVPSRNSKGPAVIAKAEPVQPPLKSGLAPTVEGPAIPDLANKKSVSAPAVEKSDKAASQPQAKPPENKPNVTQTEKPESPETVTMAFVSETTGLKIYWVLSKNFTWEEDKK